VRGPIQIPEAWERIECSGLHGPVLILGAADSGKSTLARYLSQQLASRARVALLDTDLGQNSLFLPTTMALTLKLSADPELPRIGPPEQVFFVGSNSPKGYEARVMVGLYRLLTFAMGQHARTVIIDTSGFVDPVAGGAALKWAKIELCMPCTVIAVQREDEIEPLVRPLRRQRGLHLIEIAASAAVQPRSPVERRAYRAARYRAYFAGAASHPLPLDRLPLFPDAQPVPGRVLAVENAEGFVQAMGLVERLEGATLWVRTPTAIKEAGAVIRMASLRLDPATYEDALV